MSGADRPCPCGSGTVFARCCEPVVDGSAPAATAEQLMRSRYSANVIGDARHLARSWHPRTRPADLRLDPDLRWTRLHVQRVVDGGIDDSHGLVEFEASWEQGGRSGHLHEVSRFERRAGRWVYLEGNVVEPDSPST